jgi:ABC-type uncharacterized transport system auxiliary subunit
MTRQNMTTQLCVSTLIILSLVGCKSESSRDDLQQQQNNAIVAKSIASTANQIAQLNKNASAPSQTPSS